MRLTHERGRWIGKPSGKGARTSVERFGVNRGPDDIGRFEGKEAFLDFSEDLERLGRGDYKYFDGGKRIYFNQIWQMMIHANSFAVKNVRYAWSVIAAVIIVGGFWAKDERPPIVILKPVSIIEAAPGYTAYLSIGVDRELDRRCEFTVQTSKVTDAQGYQWPVPSVDMSREEIKEMDRRVPHEIRIPIPIASGAAIGPASFQLVRLYKCNPYHTFVKPISVRIIQPFMILERENSIGE